MMILSDLTPCCYLLQPSIFRPWRKPAAVNLTTLTYIYPTRWPPIKNSLEISEIFKQRWQSIKSPFFLKIKGHQYQNHSWNLTASIKIPSELLVFFSCCGWPRSSCTTHHAQHDLIETPWSHFWKWELSVKFPVWEWNWNDHIYPF